MIAVDTNILIYAYREEMPQHARAAEALAELASSGQSWAIPWPCAHEFLATVTNRRAFPVPSPTSHALAALDAWTRRDEVRLLSETPRHQQMLASLIEKGTVVGPRIHDARIAAICLSHGVSTLWTADRDFALFPQLKWENPLLP